MMLNDGENNLVWLLMLSLWDLIGPLVNTVCLGGTLYAYIRHRTQQVSELHAGAKEW